MFMRSASELVAPIAQHEPLHHKLLSGFRGQEDTQRTSEPELGGAGVPVLWDVLVPAGRAIVGAVDVPPVPVGWESLVGGWQWRLAAG